MIRIQHLEASQPHYSLETRSSISVIIDWTPAEEGVIHEAIAAPEPAQSLTFLTRSRIQVILFYNTQYNITLAAITYSAIVKTVGE